MASDSKTFTTAKRSPFIVPVTARVKPGSPVAFTGSGGSGAGYSWALAENNTGGTIDAVSGTWTAGPLLGTDTIQLTDSAGDTCFVQAASTDSPTLLDLRTEARQRADRVDDPNITDGELNRYINASYGELYDLLVSAFDGMQTMALPTDITCDGTSDTFPFPNDMFKLRGIDVRLSNTPQGFLTVRRLPFRERNMYSYPMQGASGLRDYRYTDMGDSVRIMPRPSNGTVLRIWYVPRLTKLVSDTDATVDGTNGWTDFVVLDAAIKMLLKQEQDASPLMVQKQVMKSRIEQMSKNKDMGSPGQVADTVFDDMGSELGRWPSRGGF